MIHQRKSKPQSIDQNLHQHVHQNDNAAQCMIDINKHTSKWEKHNHSYMNMNSGIYLVKKKNERKEMY